MACRAKLVSAVLLLAVAGSSWAGYASVRPPAGWSGAAGGGAGGWYTRGQQTTQTWSAGGTMFVDSTLGVFTQNVGVPAVVQAASTAGAALAPVVIANPAIAAAVSVAAWLAPIGLQWLASQGSWGVPDTTSVVSDGSFWRISGRQTTHGRTWPGGQYYSGKSICNAFKAWLVANGAVNVQAACTGADQEPITWQDVPGGAAWGANTSKQGASGCAAGWYYTASGACVETREYTAQSADQAASLLKGQPMPWGVLNEVPASTPIPIDRPVLNGNKPLFIPTGPKVPNPKYDPGLPESKTNPKWLQPGIKAVPTPSGPAWQVDVEPWDEPVLDGDPDPTSAPREPDSAGNGQKPQDPDFCAKHPTVAGCQELGSLDPQDLPTKDVPLSITPAGGFGPSDGTCPQGVSFSLSGQTFELGYDSVCSFARGVRPIVLGFAWLAAGLLFFGFVRKT